jgi:hypothetical protein
MSFEKTVEKAIRDAMREGKFAPEDMRAALAVVKNANVFPEEVELLNEIARLERELDAARDPEWKESLRGQIEEHRVRLSILLERNRQSR